MMRMAGYPLFTLIPVRGTLERSIYDLLLSIYPKGIGVRCLAVQLGTDAEAVLQAFNNLNNGMFQAENDFELSYDA